MGKEKNNFPGVAITGPITVNGPMFDIHDNEHVYIVKDSVNNDALQPTSKATIPRETDNGVDRSASDAKAIEKCFKFNNDFVKRSVSALVTDFYQGNYANLALIEVTLFHHQQLKRRNSHKAFVMALAAWGIITIADEKELGLIVMGVGDKYKRLPMEGYKEWDDNHKTDRLICERMGGKLDPSMQYWK